MPPGGQRQAASEKLEFFSVKMVHFVPKFSSRLLLFFAKVKKRKIKLLSGMEERALKIGMIMDPLKDQDDGIPRNTSDLMHSTNHNAIEIRMGV